MISLKLLAAAVATFSVTIAESYGKKYDCSNTCAEEIKSIEGYQDDCYEFLSMQKSEVARYLNKVPKKYKYVCKDKIDFVNACYCLDPKKKRTYTTEDCDPTTTTDYVLVPTTETTTTTTTDSTTTTTTTTTTESSCPTDPATCDTPYTCNVDIPTCGPQGSPCFCASTTEGDNVCIINFFCNDVQQCTASTGCPSGQRCVTNTCCPSSCVTPATNDQCVAASEQQGLRMPAGRRVRGSTATF